MPDIMAFQLNPEWRHSETRPKNVDVNYIIKY